MRILIAMLLVSGLSVFAATQATNQKPAPSAAEQEVTTAVANWLDSSQHGNAAALRKLVADDFIGTTFGGRVVEKDDIAPEDAGASFEEASVQDLHVRAYGDTAIAIGALVFKTKEPGTLRFTEVWHKNRSGWQMVAAHLSRVP